MPDCVVPESVEIGEGSEEDENGYSTAGVGNLRPTGQIRPAESKLMTRHHA